MERDEPRLKVEKEDKIWVIYGLQGFHEKFKMQICVAFSSLKISFESLDMVDKYLSRPVDYRSITCVSEPQTGWWIAMHQDSHICFLHS